MGSRGKRMTGVRFSIIITCHNQRDFIRDAVDSAVSQAVPEKEIIVVDDASDDGSPEILEQYGHAIRLIRLGQNGGASKARNEGASVAGGDYLVFLDGDDAFMPWALAVYDCIVDIKRPKIILSDVRFFWGALSAVEKQAVPRKIELVDYNFALQKDRTCRTSASTIVVDRRAFQRVEGWSEEFFPMEDNDLLVKLGCAGRAVQVLYPFTIFYRLHESNSVRQVPPFMGMAHRMIGKAKRGEYPGGRAHRFVMYAFVGGFIAFWVKRAFRAGLHREGCKLMFAGGSLIIAAVTRRAATIIRGRRPTEQIELPVVKSCESHLATS
jgi:glycosyltransferase involved in cell wall biosynthesis